MSITNLESTSELSPELRLLLVLSKLNLSESEVNEATLLLANVQDWKCFVQRSIGTYLAPIMHVNMGLLNASIPEKVKDALCNSYNQVLVRNIRLYESYKVVLNQLTEAEVKCIPMKGIYLAESVYRDIGLRHLSDIDLLVKSADADKVCEIMMAQNWEVKKSKPRSKFEAEQFKHAHPFTFFKNGVTVELHTHLYNRNQRASITEEQLWMNANEEPFLEDQIYQFNNEMLLQHFCLHLYKHLIGSETKLVSFCDIRELISKRDKSLNWGTFRLLCEEYGCHNEVAQTLYLCRSYWRVQIPEAFFENTSPDQMVEDKFLMFLNGKAKNHAQTVENNVNKSLKMLSSITGAWGKMQFAIGLIFPTSEFMYRHFQLTKKTLLLPYYILRFLQLIAKLFTAGFNRVFR
ncbi:MAG: hypothetical protein ACI8VL_001187 [Bacteroidia bacterium]|jgi:hypothetical protein